MSTRSLICMEIPKKKDQYKVIYCHCDGYLTYNGAMLLDHYNTREKVEALLELGNISCLQKKIYPNPDLPHGFEFDQRQEDVVVAYGRDRGETDQEAQFYTFKELQEEGWIEYVYIFDKDGKWKYMEYPFKEVKDLIEGLDKEYKNLGIRRPKDYYGFFSDNDIKHIKEEQAKEDKQNQQGEMD